MYDVIVVGGGPAGSSAARHSARLGVKTLLLDRAAFPRDKLCGGALSEYGLRSLDFDLPDDMIERTIRGVHLHYQEISSKVEKSYRLAVLISRYRFDHLLFQKASEAGAETLQERKVAAVSVEKDGATVTTATGETYRSRVVIGCDGCHSVTARALPVLMDKKPLGTCIEMFVPTTEEAINTHYQDTIGIYIDVIPGGYGWVFPHRGALAVGIGGWANRVGDIRREMQNFLDRTGISSDEKMKGYAIPLAGVHRRISADRILLAGDAAGTVDPSNGEGMAYSIRSGQLAAETAAEAIRRGNCSAAQLRTYDHRCEAEFGRSLRWSSYFMRLVHRFPRLVLRTLVGDAEALSRYVDIPVRNTSYEQFLGWLLPRLPWKLLHPPGKNPF